MHTLTEIQKVKQTEDGTYLILRIPKLQLQDMLMEKRIRQAEIRFDDGRTISIEQRKKAYATIKDIAEYEGNPPEIEKELMKYQHMINTGCDYFSLSDCTMDTAREFINTLMEHAITNGIPLADMGVERTDDIGRYLYYCLKAKKCCVCGKPGEIHHVDTIGMGNDRRKVDDSEYRKMCLCREHHTMWHNLGDERFQKMYKVYGIVIKDQLPPGDNISHKSP